MSKKKQKLRPLLENEIASFFLKPPDKVRRTFAIVRKITGPELNSPEYNTIDTVAIRNLNAGFLSGEIKKDKARSEFKELIKAYLESEKQRRKDLITSPQNKRALDSYLRHKYPNGMRLNMDFNSAKNESARVLAILGKRSIYSISEDDLQALINKLDRNIQKRYVSRLRSILNFLGRQSLRLYYRPPTKRRVSYIDENDLKTLVKSIRRESKPIAGVSPAEFADFVVSSFCLGTRIGEAIALTRNGVRSDKYYARITGQIKQDGQFTQTKNDKERNALIIPFGLEAVERWASLNKENFCRFKAAKYMREKTTSLFDDTNKHITPHGLRHSYAIHLLRVVDTSIANVAMFLGDSIKTCEEYYIDFIASDSNIESVLRKIMG